MEQLIMFICNHCPYVKAIIKELVEDIKELKKNGIETVAIMSNDTKIILKTLLKICYLFQKRIILNFHICLMNNQEIAKKFGAVCTPDFFGYNKLLKLQYRGRFRELKNLTPIKNGESDLKKAMLNDF